MSENIKCVYTIIPFNIPKCITNVFTRLTGLVEVRNSIKAEIWTISNNRTTNCQSKMKEKREEKKLLDENR